MGWCQAFCGILAVAVALLVGLIFHVSRVPNGVHIDLLQNDERVLGQAVPELTPRQVQEYKRDGFVMVRQLISQQEAAALQTAAEHVASKNFDIFGFFGGTHTYKKVMFDLWRTSPEIASLSLQALPRVASQIMLSQTESEDNDSGSTSFRLLRDAYFLYEPSGTGCGWHVDDLGFFPANKEANGPTFWIALDPLLIQEGGGIAILNRTHFQEQQQQQQSPLSEDDCRLAVEGATCDMEEKSPECQTKMEASKMQFDMQPGDALIWDRYTFHRGVSATDKFPKGDDVTKKRYSVRYIPHGATAKGAVHSSVGQGQLFDSPYYPQVWPTLLPKEMKALEHGLDQDITVSSALAYMAKVLAKKYLPSFLYEPVKEGA
mmetsp:Transcript_10569/g.23441  ORF Transcript_10569/g.23441 Transcript_10569/m.23441 type:complete len:375 (+) Transcript_10569:235-1359(+)|eukprot:CAMPEP_0168746196 /NCGR_PEP_ID=MMETSP0724-20121128/15019_1 /TAXON_ID=265536 /ORGANISM="Amphiprora sp., Strain CCMP467" /LENGTH=374 /DNA_ID=CAMNT_0008793953 /DNA_START=235 /DNA_END=1359 /DNA_ORIENTATION=-